jgi:predicted peptidase
MVFKPADKWQDLLEKRAFTSGDARLPYRLLKPEGDDAKKRYPLVIFLHGAGERSSGVSTIVFTGVPRSGERGSDNTRQLVHGVAEFAKEDNREKYPCFLVAPQCPAGAWWSNVNLRTGEMGEEPSGPGRLVLGLIESVRKEFPVDAKRIYITGLSMGGFGTFDLISRKPDLFAAAIPICGGGAPDQAKKLAKVPMWVFHGGADRVVPPQRSRDMVEAIKKAGGKPKYTEYKGVGHDSWTRTYRDPKVLKWLFEQKKE